MRVLYDPSETNADGLAEILMKGGYRVGEREGTAAPPTNKPAWASAGARATATNPADLAMSGDHRKY